MKIVIAPDSFKGSLSSYEAGAAIKDAAFYVMPDSDISVLPLADGGEGTAQALIDFLGGEMIDCEVSDPLGNRIEAQYGITENNIAVIDSASAAGLTLVEESLRNPMNTTSRGLGEMIDNAIRRGCREFIIGLGGSATNDAGMGMLEALGVKFSNRFGSPISNITGKDISEIKHIDFSGGNRHIPECHFRIACDVENPLCGLSGCSLIFAPQKGADESESEALESALSLLAETVKMDFHRDMKNEKGAGAAGGLGWAFMTFFGSKYERGANIIIDVTGLETALEGADIFVTGEGRIDAQTIMGKAPAEAAKIASEKGALTVALCGCAGNGAEKVNAHGIDAYFSVMQNNDQNPLDKETATINLFKTAVQVFNLLKLKNFR